MHTPGFLGFLFHIATPRNMQIEQYSKDWILPAMKVLETETILKEISCVAGQHDSTLFLSDDMIYDLRVVPAAEPNFLPRRISPISKTSSWFSCCVVVYLTFVFCCTPPCLTKEWNKRGKTKKDKNEEYGENWTRDLPLTGLLQVDTGVGFKYGCVQQSTARENGCQMRSNIAVCPSCSACGHWMQPLHNVWPQK